MRSLIAVLAAAAVLLTAGPASAMPTSDSGHAPSVASAPAPARPDRGPGGLTVLLAGFGGMLSLAGAAAAGAHVARRPQRLNASGV
jgi:hypothetical protein